MGNMFQLMKMIQQSGNPQNFVLSMLQKQAGSNPLFNNLLSLAKQNKTEEILEIAENMCKERGLDFNKEFSSFKSSLGLK